MLAVHMLSTLRIERVKATQIYKENCSISLTLSSILTIRGGVSSFIQEMGIYIFFK